MKITIGGDVSIRDCAREFDSCQTEVLFGNIIDVFKSSDRVLINLECAVTECDNPIKKNRP